MSEEQPMSKEQLEAKIKDLGDKMATDHTELRAWQSECREKFGFAPEIPELR